MNGKKALLLLGILLAAGYLYWRTAIPINRVDISSELVMLGDLDGDHRWSERDQKTFQSFREDPFSFADDFAWRLDLNRNGLLDQEDAGILNALVGQGGDPYGAEDQARRKGMAFPRPRELYRYLSDSEYLLRPLWALPHTPGKGSALAWYFDRRTRLNITSYDGRLDAAIFAEAVRFDQAWQKRRGQLLQKELMYAERKLSQLRKMDRQGDKHELLLGFIELVEDAETLTVRGPSEAPLKYLTLRDHVRDLLASPLFADFEAGRVDWRDILRQLSGHLWTDIGVRYDFETLGKPRNLTSLENYLKRSEWQYYKSTATENDFRSLIAYAQHDPRYLAAVSRTMRKYGDPLVMNHNLPMVLLFREALRIKGNDKKKAVGLLDEAIRIPYGWIRSVPRNALPGSVALENFLLPGNREDGADKSRHWNVFGGICLYKTPEEALDLALKREMQDLRKEQYSVAGMREFLRDMIANLNGMYHVMVLDARLLK